MNKTKLLSIALLALLVLNFGILGFLFLTKDKGEHRERNMPREIIIQKLHFDGSQVIQYDKTIKIHRETITTLDDSIKMTKNNLYQLLNNEQVDVAKKDSLYLKLANYQRQIEETHFNHFLEIKAICKEQQLADYYDLTSELSKIFSHPKKPKDD